MTQQCAKIFEEACMPYQYALSTRVGTDCVARVVRLLTELDPKKTLLSIDGIGAFDHIKWKSMLEALHNNPVLAPPSVCQDVLWQEIHVRVVRR